jgi:hypothetical protein
VPRYMANASPFFERAAMRRAAGRKLSKPRRMTVT